MKSEARRIAHLPGGYFTEVITPARICPGNPAVRRLTARARTVTAVVAALLVVVLGGCSEGSRGGSNQPGVPEPSVVTGPPGAPAAADNRMSINTSSEQDVAAALDAKEVDDSERWAKLIVANKPYPPDDPAQSRLRQVLTSSGADPQTVDEVLAALKP